MVLQYLVICVRKEKKNIRIGPPYSQFLSIHSPASMELTNLGQCSTVVFTMEKNSPISGPTLFKLMLLDGQLYDCGLLWDWGLGLKHEF